MQLDKMEDAIAAIAAGDPVVVVDDADRENEGDLIMAASLTTPEKMGFLVRHTSGIICVPMTARRAEQLNLPPMVAHNTDPKRTAFTVSVDCKWDLTTGISAKERANTARALASDKSGPGDFRRPGHIFPLVAREGGVLTRSGHTEAATDLTRLAGLPEVGVLAEIVNDDGSMKRLAELVPFAREHGLRIVSIEDLVAYRFRHEACVSCVSEEIVTLAGMTGHLKVYESAFDPVQHLAVVFGDVTGAKPVLAHIHRAQPFDDILARDARGSVVLDDALRQMQTAGTGVLVLVRSANARDVAGVTDNASDEGEHHGAALARQRKWLDAGAGAQILRDIGVSTIELAAAGSAPHASFGDFGIDVVGPLRKAG